MYDHNLWKTYYPNIHKVTLAKSHWPWYILKFSEIVQTPKWPSKSWAELSHHGSHRPSFLPSTFLLSFIILIRIHIWDIDRATMALA